MKAIIKKRLEDNNNKVELGKVLPLETPYVLMIDPSSACNHRCIFCPTGNHKLIRYTNRYQGSLNFGLYKKIIDDTQSFSNPIKVLRMYKVGEPLLNNRFADMVDYARKSNNIQKIETTTNGLLFNNELNKKIIKAGINQINISVNGVSEEKIFYFTKTKVDFKKYVENIKNLYDNKGDCEIYIKAIKQNLTQDEQKMFFDIFGEICDRIFLENLSPAWPGYIFENLKMQFTEGHYGQKAYERKICPYIFYIMVINADGSVSTCVQDWKQDMIVGDTKNENLRDIWLGERLNEYRLNHLKLKKCSYDTCSKCEVMSYGVLDDIDGYADCIIKKMDENIYQ